MHETEIASQKFPSVALSTGERLHVFEMSPSTWEIWLNCEDSDFTGICVAVGDTRADVVAAAVKVFEAAVAELRKPIPLESAQPCGCDPGANWTCEAHRTGATS